MSADHVQVNPNFKILKQPPWSPLISKFHAQQRPIPHHIPRPFVVTDPFSAICRRRKRRTQRRERCSIHNHWNTRRRNSWSAWKRILRNKWSMNWGNVDAFHKVQPRRPKSERCVSWQFFLDQCPINRRVPKSQTVLWSRVRNSDAFSHENSDSQEEEWTRQTALSNCDVVRDVDVSRCFPVCGVLRQCAWNFLGLLEWSTYNCPE